MNKKLKQMVYYFNCRIIPIFSVGFGKLKIHVKNIPEQGQLMQNDE